MSAVYGFKDFTMRGQLVRAGKHIGAGTTYGFNDGNKFIFIPEMPNIFPINTPF